MRAAVVLLALVALAVAAHAAAEAGNQPSGATDEWTESVIQVRVNARSGEIEWKGQVYVPERRRLSEVEAEPPVGDPDDLDPTYSSSFWRDVGISTALVCTAGLMAGLTMGFVSLDPTYLEILARTGTPTQKAQASRVAPLVHRHHLVLVTLLLANSAANEALPIFLNRVVPEYLAIIFSVTAVLFFGEIIPSALFTGPKQLAIASRLHFVVRFLVFAFFIVSWPIAWLLDRLLGDDHGITRFRRRELKEFIRMHTEDSPEGVGMVPTPTPDHMRSRSSRRLGHDGQSGAHPSTAASDATAPLLGGASPHTYVATDPAPFDDVEASLVDRNAAHAASGLNDGAHGVLTLAKPEVSDEAGALSPRRSSTKFRGAMESKLLTFDEVSIITGALELTHKTVGMLTVPTSDVFMLSTDDRMNEETMTRVLRSSHSRVPVHLGSDPNRVLGVAIVKWLIPLNPADATPVSSLRLRRPVVMHPVTALADALNVFQTGGSHLALVTEQDDSARAALRAGKPVPEGVRILGIITLEDILEELIQEDILDESDVAGAPPALIPAPGAAAAPSGSRVPRVKPPARKIGEPGPADASDVHVPERMRRGNSRRLNPSHARSILLAQGGESKEEDSAFNGEASGGESGVGGATAAGGGGGVGSD